MKFNLYVRSSILAALALGVFIMTIKGSETSLQEERMSWGEAQGGFRLGVQGMKNDFSVKDAILLVMYLKNISDEPLRVIITGNDYEITVLDRDGNNVPLTRYGKHLANEADRFFLRVVLAVEPGEELRDELHVNRIFDMTLSGQYFVNISRSVPKRVGDGFVKIESKRIAINVTD